MLENPHGEHQICGEKTCGIPHASYQPTPFSLIAGVASGLLTVERLEENH
jgi:hypothetical protein